MTNGYSAPTITDLGSFADLTLSGGLDIQKNAGSGDVITISGQSVSVPGHGVIKIS